MKAKTNENMPHNPKGNTDPDVDALGELLAWEETIKPKLAELKKLKAKMAKRVEEGGYDPTESVLLPGAEYDIEYSPCRSETEVTDIKTAQKFLGNEAFYKLVTLPVGALKDYLTQAQRDKVSVTTPTGARSVKLAKRKT